MTDILIIGGGVMGCSVAMHLAALAGPSTRIAVVERDPSYRTCATTRSAGGVRQQFSTPECILMSQATVAYVKAATPTSDLAFREQGYLLLASEAGLPTLEENAALQRSRGADTRLLAATDLAARFPWLDPTGVAAAGFGASGEGWLDPALLLQHLRAEARALGVSFVAGEVTAVEREGARVTAAILTNGTRIAAGELVNCAGPSAGAVAHHAGVELPVEPRKRFVFVFDCREAPAALHDAPLTVDPSGVWFRPEGRQFICGLSSETDADEPDPADLDTIDHALFEERIWPVLAARVPRFDAIKLTGAWAGHYDYNTFDQNAVIGPHDEVANLHFCTGFSGHGLQHAIAAGRAVAERIVHGRFVTLDLTRLGYDRIRRREPLIERNVI
jgi:FAD-dependent oxidoreductase domain-containing protein 1